MPDTGTFVELCVSDEAGTSCYTHQQLDSLLSSAGCIFGASSSANENADAPEGASGAPASSARGSADAASSTMESAANPQTTVVTKSLPAPEGTRKRQRDRDL